MITRKLNYLLIAVFAISVAFMSCDPNNDDDNNGNGNGNGGGNGSEPEKEWVEINGVKWATRNVDKPGTFAAKSEDAGMFYQWNRKIGWSSKDPLVNSNGGTTWNDSDEPGDVWEKANDPCPAGYRMPTREEHTSLAAADSKWDTKNGVKGCTFGSGNTTIFLPAAGFRNYRIGKLTSNGTDGNYWSTDTRSYIGEITGYNLHFYYASGNVSVNPNAYDDKPCGNTIRCVKE